jgi:hypothetical protein
LKTPLGMPLGTMAHLLVGKLKVKHIH